MKPQDYTMNVAAQNWLVNHIASGYSYCASVFASRGYHANFYIKLVSYVNKGCTKTQNCNTHYNSDCFMHKKFGMYEISDAQSRLQTEAILALLASSYWAGTRPREAVLRSLESSVCFGVYLHQEQVGFARLVTDYATVYWLCDVLVAQEHRGQGLGKALMRVITADSRFSSLTGILATQNAHGLYQQFGFKREPHALMWTR